MLSHSRPAGPAVGPPGFGEPPRLIPVPPQPASNASHTVTSATPRTREADMRSQPPDGPRPTRLGQGDRTAAGRRITGALQCRFAHRMDPRWARTRLDSRPGRRGGPGGRGGLKHRGTERSVRVRTPPSARVRESTDYRLLTGGPLESQR